MSLHDDDPTATSCCVWNYSGANRCSGGARGGDGGARGGDGGARGGDGGARGGDGGARGSCNSASSYYPKVFFNFQIILIIYCIINLINAKDIANQRLGCNLSDHQACDELCKQDSYWYGHCSTWDGRDFTCTCYQYKVPLNGSLCKQMQRICKEYCIKRGLDGGYCYVHASWTAPNGTTQCKCFEELLQTLR